MPKVFRLAYVDLATPSFEDTLEYYSQVIGATTTERSGDDAYLSLGLDHHNIALHADSNPGLRAIGLQIGAAVSLDDVARHLGDLGLRAQLRTDARPGVPALLDVPDVGGHSFQLLASMEAPAVGFGKIGVVPNRIGHVAIITSDAARVLSFLTEGLGFWKTDWFEEQVTFVTCNRDHHVMNVIEAPFSAAHHLAFELRGRDHLLQAMDQLAQRRLPSVWGPSRHTAGHNMAAYHHGADNLLVELYTDMDVYLPDLGSFEPRPWHEDLPQRPKHWAMTQMTAWETNFEFDFRTAAFGA